MIDKELEDLTIEEFTENLVEASRKVREEMGEEEYKAHIAKIKQRADRARKGFVHNLVVKELNNISQRVKDMSIAFETDTEGKRNYEIYLVINSLISNLMKLNMHYILNQKISEKDYVSYMLDLIEDSNLYGKKDLHKLLKPTR